MLFLRFPIFKKKSQSRFTIILLFFNRQTLPFVFTSHFCITNYHTNLVISNSTHLFSYSSGSQNSKMSFPGMKSWCQQNRTPSGSCRGNQLPCLFQSFELRSFSFLAGGPFLYLHSQKHSTLLQLSCCLLSLQSNILLLPSFKALVIAFRDYPDNLD